MTAAYRFALAVGVGLCLAASTAAAQSLTGRVVADPDGEALESVHVVLLDAEGGTADEVFTDTAGSFMLEVPEVGTWRLRAEVIGYATVVSAPVAVGPGETVTVQVRMGVEAVSVDPVVVTGRVSSLSPDIQEFYDRVRAGRTSGFGRFVTREDVDRSAATEPSDLLRSMAGVRVVRLSGRARSGSAITMSSGCVPAIFVDGTQINRVSGMADFLDDFVTAGNIEGIEVYRGAGQQVDRFHDSRGCGLVLVWTRRGSTDGRPFSWARLGAAAALLLGFLVLF